MEWNSFQVAIQKNQSGADLLGSQHYADALPHLLVAFQLAHSVKESLETAFAESLAHGQYVRIQPPCHAPFDNHCTRQTLFPVRVSRQKDCSDECHYLYDNPLVFDGSLIVPPQDRANSSSSPVDAHHLLYIAHLLVATILYNMALCFHLRSQLADEGMKETFQQVALHIYNYALEIIGQPMVASQNVSHTDSSSLLVIAMNNKAVLCYEHQEYNSCQDARNLLILCLNAVVLSGDATQSFLSGEEMTDLYRNGFLLERPRTAGAA